MRHILWLSLIIAAQPVLAEDVVFIDPNQKMVVLQNDPTGTWKKEDTACIVRDAERMGCGVIRGFSALGAHLVLQGTSQPIKVGDSSYKLKNPIVSREPASQSIVGIAFEEPVPVKRFNLLAGAYMSLDVQVPTLSFQYAVTDRVVLGLQPAFLTNKLADNSAKLTGYGASLTAAYYFNGAYRGPWTQLSSGFYSYKAEGGGVTDTSSSPVITGLIGWRERWAGRSNIGIGLGFRYMPHLTNLIPTVKFRELYPIASVDIGLEW